MPQELAETQNHNKYQQVTERKTRTCTDRGVIRLTSSPGCSSLSWTCCCPSMMRPGAWFLRVTMGVVGMVTWGLNTALCWWGWRTCKGKVSNPDNYQSDMYILCFIVQFQEVEIFLFYIQGSYTFSKVKFKHFSSIFKVHFQVFPALYGCVLKSIRLSPPYIIFLSKKQTIQSDNNLFINATRISSSSKHFSNLENTTLKIQAFSRLCSTSVNPVYLT